MSGPETAPAAAEWWDAFTVAFFFAGLACGRILARITERSRAAREMRRLRDINPELARQIQSLADRAGRLMAGETRGNR